MSEIDRRRVAEAIGAFAALLASGRALAASGNATGEPASRYDMTARARWRGAERIAFLIYPGFTALDMVGPHYMLASLMGAKVDIVAKSLAPVRSDAGLIFMPSSSFEKAVANYDVFCVPGGSDGTLAALRDEATISYARETGRRARLVTSVCTGSLLLGAAGLLEGYRATSHWVTKSLLPVFGAIPTDGRFVRDRNRMTAEGVTAGLDFSLALVAELRDKEYAQGVQLLAQYAPSPPFNAGEPGSAPPQVTKMIKEMLSPLKKDLSAAAAAAFAKSKSF